MQRAQGALLHMSQVSIPLKGHPLLFCFLFFKTKVLNILIKGVHTDYLVSDCLDLDVNCQELSERTRCLYLDSLGAHGKLQPLLLRGRKQPVP